MVIFVRIYVSHIHISSLDALQRKSFSQFIINGIFRALLLYLAKVNYLPHI